MIDESIFSVHSYLLAAFLSEMSKADPHMQSMASCTENSGETFVLWSLMRMQDRSVFRARISYPLPCVSTPNHPHTHVNPVQG